MKPVMTMCLVAIVVLGLGSSAAAQGSVGMDWWLAGDTVVSFPGDTPADQEIASDSAVFSASLAVGPADLGVQYGTKTGADLTQGPGTATVDASSLVVTATYPLISDYGLTAGPTVGYALFKNAFDWGVATYSVDASGLVVGGSGEVTLAEGASLFGAVLYGPLLGVADTSSDVGSGMPESYSASVLGFEAGGKLTLAEIVSLRAGYRSRSLTGYDGSVQYWTSQTAGFFVGATLGF